jgi:hypothetical protein
VVWFKENIKLVERLNVGPTAMKKLISLDPIPMHGTTILLFIGFFDVSNQKNVFHRFEPKQQPVSFFPMTARFDVLHSTRSTQSML